MSTSCWRLNRRGDKLIVRKSDRGCTVWSLSVSCLSGFLIAWLTATSYINWVASNGAIGRRNEWNKEINLSWPRFEYEGKTKREYDLTNFLRHSNISSSPLHDEIPSPLIDNGSDNNRLPESQHYAIHTLLSNVTEKEIQSTMKSAYVYKPGSWDGAGIVIEELKLVFFTQGKVACTVFKQLFRRIMRKQDWNSNRADLTHNPRKNGLKYLFHYDFRDALRILTHPEWTRAIFVRDPKERVLSAFLDKAARKNGTYVKRHCCSRENSTCGELANDSFLGFLRVIETVCCCDPHWMPQTKRVDKAFVPFINFVGHFENIQDDTKKLLKLLSVRYADKHSVDLWTSYGASGWGESGNESIFSTKTKARHQTSASGKLQNYYNATTEALVERLFADDYADPILNFTRYSISNDAVWG